MVSKVRLGPAEVDGSRPGAAVCSANASGQELLAVQMERVVRDTFAPLMHEVRLNPHCETGELLAGTNAVFAEVTAGDPDEEMLVQQAVQGRQDAFVQLYDQHYDRIYRYIARRIGRIEDIEDLTQQVFLQAWSAIRRYEQRGSPFGAWLYTIAHNEVVSAYRRKPMYGLTENICDQRPGCDTEQHAVDRWQGEQVSQAILLLTPLERTVITLRFRDNLKPCQIAIIVSKSEVNVRVIQCRTLRKLRRMLEPASELAG